LYLLPARSISSLHKSSTNHTRSIAIRPNTQQMKQG
jgi:hypothetical protein